MNRSTMILRAHLFRLGPTVVGFAFVLAGWAKLADPSPAVRLLMILGLSPGVADLVVFGLGPSELAIGLLLAFQVHRRCVVAGAAGMLTVFSTALVYLIAMGQSADCSCFPKAVASLPGNTPAEGIARNVVLLSLLSVATLWKRCAGAPRLIVENVPV